MPALTAADSAVGVVARRRAAAVRASWKLGIAQGLMTVQDAISYASTEDGAPLLSVRLEDLLRSQPGVGDTKASFVMYRYRKLCGAPPDATVGWMLDGRGRPGRFDAWVEATQPPRTPWSGFPYAPPTGGSG